MHRLVAVQIGSTIKVKKLSGGCDGLALLVYVQQMSGIKELSISGLTDILEMPQDEIIPILGPDKVQVIGQMVISNDYINIEQGELVV